MRLQKAKLPNKKEGTQQSGLSEIWERAQGIFMAGWSGEKKGNPKNA